MPHIKGSEIISIQDMTSTARQRCNLLSFWDFKMKMWTARSMKICVKMCLNGRISYAKFEVPSILSSCFHFQRWVMKNMTSPCAFQSFGSVVHSSVCAPSSMTFRSCISEDIEVKIKNLKCKQKRLSDLTRNTLMLLISRMRKLMCF